MHFPPHPHPRSFRRLKRHLQILSDKFSIHSPPLLQYANQAVSLLSLQIHNTSPSVSLTDLPFVSHEENSSQHLKPWELQIRTSSAVFRIFSSHCSLFSAFQMEKFPFSCNHLWLTHLQIWSKSSTRSLALICVNFYTFQNGSQTLLVWTPFGFLSRLGWNPGYTICLGIPSPWRR